MRQVLITAGKKQGSYTLIIPPNIGKYVAENSPARASRHFSVPETTARSVSGKSAKF